MRRLFVVAIIAVFVFAVFVLCEFLRLKSSISYSLDFGSVLDSIILFAVFVAVDYAYSRQSSRERSDTELLLDIVGEAKRAFRELHEKSQYCNQKNALADDQRLALTRAARELSNSIHSIEEGLRHCNVDRHAVDLGPLRDARLELNESLTDTPYPGPYDAAALSRISAASKALRDELIRISFAINHR